MTKGAAKLFGFYPVESDSFATDHHSDKPPDMKQHYVDLVIPEIPSIACKKNSSGKDIIERIQFNIDNSDMIHYRSSSRYNTN